MKKAHILILTFVLLVAVAVGAYIIHDRHNNTANMGYNGERRNITTFSEYIGDERVVFYPVIETLEAFGAKVQEENDRYIIHVGDKKYILEQNEHPLYDGDAVTLYDTKMSEQNLLLIPPGSYGSPTRKDGDVYVNDATITHVFTQMGLEGYLDEIDVMISESDDLALTNEGPIYESNINKYMRVKAFG